MMKADRITVEIQILAPTGTDTASAIEGMSVQSMIDAVITAGGAIGPVAVMSSVAVEGDDAAIQVAQSGADIAPYVGEIEALIVVRPATITELDDHLATVPILQAFETDAGWKGAWNFSGGAVSETPGGHPTREDAITDASRRAMASIDPEAETGEFEDIAGQDPFDPDIRYGSLFIDDENRWRGRWYRGEWGGEGAYTEVLYDTPGQARRAARRLRTTGDES